MAKEDFYSLLGVGKSSDAKEIKSAYRKMAMKYHPDRNPGDEVAAQKFRDISEAYEVLSDSQKRAAYDRYGHAAFENNAGGGGAGMGGAGFSDIGDIFEEFFGMRGGGAGGRGARRRGGDQRTNLEISLEDAFAGKNVDLRIPGIVSCDSCHGSGAAEGAQPVECSTCQGRGKTRMSQGFFTVERTCSSCGGQGKVIDNPCRSCAGQGRVKKMRDLNVDIPAGIDDGSRIRLSGEGEAGPQGAPPGDLYIFISITPHKFFERQDHHLYCVIPVSMVDAALGGEIEAPTIEGKKVKLKIPPGTQSGKQIRIKGKGMPVIKRPNRGDMYIKIEVETPVNLTSKQQELLQAFRDSGGGGAKHSPATGGFFDKVKDFLNDIT